MPSWPLILGCRPVQVKVQPPSALIQDGCDSSRQKNRNFAGRRDKNEANDTHRFIGRGYSRRGCLLWTIVVALKLNLTCIIKG